MTCEECGTRNADVLPSRGDCQTCLKARLDALAPPDRRPLGDLLPVRAGPTPQAPTLVTK